MSDYERGYSQGVEDAHRCERRHAELTADVTVLRVENARLREALTLCIERLEGLKEDGITTAEQAALDSAHAALQPERGDSQ